MNHNVLIALVIAVVMVFAHIGVFWWFVCRGGRLNAGSAKPEDPAKPEGD